MDKKYYDLIISLIKKHRKYPGLEAILDDIANDVYEHSKVVIGTVTNEEIIESYFNKVISTSIITVPKKLNYNTRTRHRIISTVLHEPVANEIKEPENVVLVEQGQNTVNNNLEVTEELENVDNADDILENEFSTEETVIEDTGIQEGTEEFEEIEVIEDLEENILSTNEPEVNVDKSLVDRMINDSTKATVEEIKENNNNFEALDTLFVNDNTQDSNQTNELEEFAESETGEELISEINELEEVEVLEDNSFKDFEETTEVELTEDVDDMTLDEIVPDEEDIENNFEELVELETDEDLVEEEFSLEVEDTDIQSIDDEDNETVLELEEEDSFEETEINEDVNEIINNTETVSEFQTIDYSCFSYKPNLEDIDLEEIQLSLNEIQKDYNDTDIINICELKFIQKKSIAEIAGQTNLNKSVIIEILNDVSEAIKE